MLVVSEVNLKHAQNMRDQAATEGRIYTLCFFERRAVVPEVVLIDAADDDDALAEASSRRAFTTREVWDRHRLVGVIEPAF